MVFNLNEDFVMSNTRMAYNCQEETAPTWQMISDFKETFELKIKLISFKRKICIFKGFYLECEGREP